jgi:hypothetical protein
MGHERVGILPRTKPWIEVLNQIEEFPTSKNIEDVAEQTIRNVRYRFKDIEKDRGVHAAFKFLVLLSHSGKFENPSEHLSSKGIELPEKFSPIKLAKAVTEWTDNHIDSNEYGAVAKQAAIDAISEWYDEHETQQVNLFTSDINPSEVWKEASDGAGFCELSRLYFSNFTESYLKYFLEREASASLNSVSDRDRFNKELEHHIEDISKHAFETSKITQSFAAGWFNKNAKDTPPSDKEINGFLSFAFKKMRDELLREES